MECIRVVEVGISCFNKIAVEELSHFQPIGNLRRGLDTYPKPIGGDAVWQAADLRELCDIIAGGTQGTHAGVLGLELCMLKNIQFVA